MIPRHALDKVSKIIVHEQSPGVSCPDGLASAIILLDAFWDRLSAKDVEFVSYNSERHNKMVAVPGMLFCDFAPPVERAYDFARVGTIVLDHHEEERVTPYEESGVWAHGPEISGATLAYECVWCPLREEMKSVLPDGTSLSSVIARFARLSAIRDMWQRNNAEWAYACGQAAALMFWPRQEWLENAIDWQTHLSRRIPIGSSLVTKRREEAERAIAIAYDFTSARGRRVLVTSTLDVSDAAELLDREPPPGQVRPTAIIGFQYFSERGTAKLQLSCRSTHDVLIRPFCQSLGGGGHPRAAGCKIDPTDCDDPYRFIEAHWNHWEKTL